MELAPSFKENVVDLIRARHPVLLVETQEFERVVREFQDIAVAPELKTKRKISLFTLSQGIHEPGSAGKPMSAEAGLSSILSASEPTIFLFFDLHHSLGQGNRPAEPAAIRGVLDVAQSFRTGSVGHTLVIVAPGLTLPNDLEKEVTVVDLPLPSLEEISQILDDIVSANQESIEVNLSASDRQRLLQAAQGLTLGEAENAFARAIAADKTLDASDVQIIQEEKRQTIRKSGLLEFIPPEGSIDDIGGLENLKKWLHKRNGSWLQDAKEWSIPSPKGVLITGVPGCGKSLTASCMSELWGLPLVRLDVGRVFSGLVGSSEQNMRNALKLAEAVSPSVLWIDEIEKGFGSTNGGGDSGTSSRVFGTFLTWMQEKKSSVFVIATANRIESLPPEFLRKGRFDEIFFVDLPTESERKVIWGLHLRKRLVEGSKVTGDFIVSDKILSELSEMSEGFSGAEIAEAVISSCFEAFSAKRAIEVEDIKKSIRNTVPLSVTQAEQITRIREWASERAVAATAESDRGDYKKAVGKSGDDVGSWRGGRTIEF